MSALNHRKLQQFIAVAEAGSFRAAAEALNMSQPPLSKSIQQMEVELGAGLFERRSTGVTLTPAGEALLKDGREILQQLKRAEQSVKASAGEPVPLRIGFVSAALAVAVPKIIRQLDAENQPHPQLTELTTPEQVDQLSSGNLDLGFLHPPIDMPAGLTCMTIASEPLMLALPEDHALCTQKSIRSADLIDERFVLFPQKQGPVLYNKLLKALAVGGQINVVAEAARIHSQLALVSSGLGIGVIGTYTAEKLSYTGVQFRHWSDRPKGIEFTLAIAGRSEVVNRYADDMQNL